MIENTSTIKIGRINVFFAVLWFCVGMAPAIGHVANRNMLTSGTSIQISVIIGQASRPNTNKNNVVSNATAKCPKQKNACRILIAEDFSSVGMEFKIGLSRSSRKPPAVAKINVPVISTKYGCSGTIGVAANHAIPITAKICAATINRLNPKRSTTEPNASETVTCTMKLTITNAPSCV